MLRPDQCKAECCSRNWCKSFDYGRSNSQCYLSDKDASDVKGGLKTDYDNDPYDHYKRGAFGKSPCSAFVSTGQTFGLRTCTCVASAWWHPNCGILCSTGVYRVTGLFWCSCSGFATGACGSAPSCRHARCARACSCSVVLGDVNARTLRIGTPSAMQFRTLTQPRQSQPAPRRLKLSRTLMSAPAARSSSHPASPNMHDRDSSVLWRTYVLANSPTRTYCLLPCDAHA